MNKICDFLLNNIEHFIQITDYAKLFEECNKRQMFTPSIQADIEELSSVADRHRLLFIKITHQDRLLKELLAIFDAHFTEAADFVKSKMKGSKPFCAPSYKSIANGQNLEVDGAAMSTSSRCNSNNVLQIFTDSVENIKNIEVQLTTAYCSSDISQCYPMKTRNRGYLFFVNISKFVDKSKFRKGAGIDKANMITLYRKFGFKIQYHENINLKTFRDLIEQLANSKQLRSIECFTLCVLSHGCFQENQQMIEFSCGNVGLVSDIVATFNNINCVDLRGRPKIFIFPMCRSPVEGIPFEQFTSRNKTTLDRVKYAAAVAEFSDIKVCFATTKGSTAYRDGIHGTWYIATFVDVLARHAHDHHFCDMLKIIGRKMDDLCNIRSCEESEEFVQTISSEEFGFNKKLYFNPGYYESGGEGDKENGIGGGDARM